MLQIVRDPQAKTEEWWQIRDTVNPWLIHVNAWQKPLQYFKVISLQLIKIKEKNKKARTYKKRDSEETKFTKAEYKSDNNRMK